MDENVDRTGRIGTKTPHKMHAIHVENFVFTCIYAE